MVARREGKLLSEQERGVVVGQLRRQLSTVSIRAASICLLDRMHQCGEGASLAAKRRELSTFLEERMNEERQVQWLAKLRGDSWFKREGFSSLTKNITYKISYKVSSNEDSPILQTY